MPTLLVLQRQYLFAQTLAYLASGYILFAIEAANVSQVFIQISRYFGFFFIVLSFALILSLIISLVYERFLYMVVPVESMLSSALLNASFFGIIVFVVTHSDFVGFPFMLLSIYIFSFLLIVFLLLSSLKLFNKCRRNWKEIISDYPSVERLAFILVVTGFVTFLPHLSELVSPFPYWLISVLLISMVLLFDPKFRDRL